jgi:hypothetical protein
MAFEQVTLHPPDLPDLKLVVYTASPDTARRLGRAMAEGDHLERSGE